MKISNNEEMNSCINSCIVEIDTNKYAILYAAWFEVENEIA